MPGAKVLRFIGVVGENTAGRKQTPGMFKKPVMLTMHLVYGHRIRVKQDALKGSGGKTGNHILPEALMDNRSAGGVLPAPTRSGADGCDAYSPDTQSGDGTLLRGQDTLSPIISSGRTDIFFVSGYSFLPG